ncbi:MAG: cation diffusion facilitator family transporter [Lachnospiraceae bacterium]|nr:cation diffusion facilitator family transporter [Lachnospiraceae bacterium]
MNENMEKTAMKVSIISIIANVVLAAFKLVAGVFAHSGAMISDAIHSASDVFSTFVVMIGIKIASKEPDEEHPYGHERMECVAAIILATILCITGLGIGKNALSNITGNSGEMAVPGVLALIAAIVSIIVKEAMFWYTRHYAKKIDSGALMADAWHHRSDALSSIGAFIGIIFARMGYVMMDSIACLVICVFIVKAAYDIFKDAVDKMVDKSCSIEVEDEIRAIVMAEDGVRGIDSLSTRLFGNKMYVDLEIRADGEKTLNETHEIAEAVHDSIEARFEKVKHIMVHVNPD